MLEPYIKKIRFDDIEWPLSFRNLKQIELNSGVNIFFGPNGAGKSTLLEALALSLSINPEGGNENTLYSTDVFEYPLVDKIKIIRSFRVPKQKFFLRTESFFGFSSYMDEVGYLKGYEVDSLHGVSHGEAIFNTIKNKLNGPGLYLMDEPEAGLSIVSQLAVLKEIKRLEAAGSQLIIATHSPILLKYPDANIINISNEGVRAVNYDDIQDVELLKRLLLSDYFLTDFLEE